MKTNKVLTYVFLIVGVALLVAAFFIYQGSRGFIKEAQSGEGVVVDLLRSVSRGSDRTSDSVTYRPVVEFETHRGEKIEFISPAGSNPPSYYRGESVRVLYKEHAPEDARINSFFSLWGTALILGGMGAVFFVLAVMIEYSKIAVAKKSQRLKSQGTPVKAIFKSVEVSNSFKVGNTTPYQIHAQWKNPRTSELHIFKSENILYDPTDYISNPELTVFIDRDNPKKYYLDISFLPKLAS